MCRRVTMGSETSAVGRTDAVQSRLEQYFENPSAENVFRDARGAFKRGPAAVISKVFVAGLHPPEFKVKVDNKLEMKSHWKEKRNELFDLIREVAIEWRTVGLADKKRHQTRAGRATPGGKSSGKQLAGKSAGGAVDKASTEVVNCFECRKPGHLDRKLPSEQFPVNASSQPDPERENEGILRGRSRGVGSRRSSGSNVHSSSSSNHAAVTAATAALLGAPGRIDALLWRGKGFRRGYPPMLSTSVMFEAVRFFLETPGNRELAQRPCFCLLTRTRLRLLRQHR